MAPLKDIRDFYIQQTKRGETPYSMLRTLESWLVEAKPSDVAHAIVRGNDDPHAYGEQLVTNYYTFKTLKTLRYFNGEWWLWKDGHYRKLPHDEMRALTNGQLRSLLDQSNSNTKVTQTLVTNVLRALEAMSLVPGTLSMPCWLDVPPDEQPDYVFVAQNGLVNIEGVIAGRSRVLLDATPSWFSLGHGSYPYDPKAKCSRWMKFLAEVLPSPTRRQFLQEIFGYCLTTDVKFQRFFIFKGEGANGKGVTSNVLTHLLGTSSVSNVGLERFHERFAMSATVGRLLNLAGEIGAIRDGAEEVLKAVTGGDRIQVETKFGPLREVKPTAKVIFATNKIPRFADRSEAIWRRMLILEFDIQIPQERWDLDLEKEICRHELPGILNWALAGLRRLWERGKFTIPPSTMHAVKQCRRDSNPARIFLEECCEPREGAMELAEEVYASYERWCATSGYQPLHDTQFGQEVHRFYGDRIDRKQGKRPFRKWQYIGPKLIKGRL